MATISARKTPVFLLALLLVAFPVASPGQQPHRLLASLPPPSQASEELVFDVLMNGSRIGQHAVTIWRESDRVFTDIEIDLKVGLGPIVFYRYEQRNRALWEGGRLIAFASTTDDDGEVFNVEGVEQADGMAVTINEADPVTVADWFPTTYWDRRTVLQNRLLATRNGAVLEVETKAIGVKRVEVKGREVRAEKFEMRGDLDLDLWYDEAGRWVKLGFDYRGNRFDYVLR